MKQAAGSDTTKRAVIKKPPFAVVAQGNSHAQTAPPDTEARPMPEARIREAAYALYEARGHVHGHDLDDWLKAEATLN